ncbi:hypothetical protein AMTR_s00045p00073370 [Amborella trichopoda]|uniref:Uncharacterized protein n=1 Tax=Amborella trichopoda TaxID=13333 RepID=W1NWG8_AMBTC|nr:hypothetical protein AMTR_s00045p00073370 [Amborella trichopoda]
MLEPGHNRAGRGSTRSTSRAEPSRAGDLAGRNRGLVRGVYRVPPVVRTGPRLTRRIWKKVAFAHRLPTIRDAPSDG